MQVDLAEPSNNAVALGKEQQHAPVWDGEIWECWCGMQPATDWLAWHHSCIRRFGPGDDRNMGTSE